MLAKAKADDNLEDVLPSLNLILFNLPTITDDLWFYYPLLCYSIIGKPSTGYTLDIT
jgi:importin-7